MQQSVLFFLQILKKRKERGKQEVETLVWGIPVSVLLRRTGSLQVHLQAYDFRPVKLFFLLTATETANQKVT